MAPLADLLDEELTSGPAISAPTALPPQRASSPFASSEPAVRLPGSSLRPRRPRASSQGFPVSGRTLAILITVGVVLLLSLLIPGVRLLVITGLFIAGALLGLVAGLWGIGVAFGEDILCGLMYLFVPFYWLYYLVTRWSEMRKPFFLGLGGAGLYMIAIMMAIGLGIGGASFGSRGRPGRGNPSQPLSVSSAPMPSFPARGTPRTIAPGVEFTQVNLGIPSGQPGQASTLYIYTPPGEHPRRSLPCVLIAPAGAPAFSGMGLGSEDQAEHIPYAKAGFAVVAYEVDGQLEGETNRAARRAYNQFSAARAGLVNARNALEYVLVRMPEVDPRRIYAAGHSSAATLALLFAEHDHRVKACAAYAPVSNIPRWLGSDVDEMEAVLPGCREFFEQASPHTHASRLHCRVFLFHAEDDSVVPVHDTTGFANDLQRLNKDVTLVTVPRGDHYDSMIREGIPRAIQWLKGSGEPGPHVAEKRPPTKPQMPPAPREPTVWEVTPDPAEPAAKLAEEPLQLNSSGTRLRGVVFSSPKTARAVVLTEGGRRLPSQPESSGPRLDHYDLASGRHLGTLELEGSGGLGDRRELADVSLSGERALVVSETRAEVWSLAEGKSLTGWQFSPQPVSRNAWAAMIDDAHVATIDSQRQLVVWTLPECQVAYKIEGVACAALSPGRRYLATFADSERRPFAGHIVEASTGEVAGDLVWPTSAGRNLRARQCVFHPDGQRLAAVGLAVLAVWNISDGTLALESRGATPTDRLAFVGDDYLMLDSKLFDLGRKAVVWEYRVAGSEISWEEVRNSTDGRTWVTVGRPLRGPSFLAPIELPDQDAQRLISAMPASPPITPGRSPLSVETLFGDTLPLATDGPDWPPSRPPGIKPAIGSAGPEYEKASRDYVRQTHVDLIASDGAGLEDRLRWFAGAERPAIGLRWALGVQWTGTGEQPPIGTQRDLAKVTGTIGPGILDGLQQRTTDGRFGDWPSRGDPRFRQVALLGGGKQAELLAAAQRQGLDILVVVNLTPQVISLSRRSDVLMRIRIVDVASKRTLWASESLSQNRVAAASRAGTDLAGQMVEQVLKEVDQDFALKPMRSLKAEDVKARAAKLGESISKSEPEALLPVLVELRFYQSRGLLETDEAAALYDRILGAGKGRVLASGDEAKRRQLLEAWLSGS